MKKIVGILFAAFLFALNFLGVDAKAETNLAEKASSYCFGSDFYSFFYLDEKYDTNDFKAEVDSEFIQGFIVQFERIKRTQTKIHYLYLIDQSGSMRKYRDMIMEFMLAVEEHETNRSDISIAYFGEKFEVVAEQLGHAEEAANIVSSMSFNQAFTDHYMGLNKAFDYIEDQGITPGDLYSVILITDGEPDFRDKSTDEVELAEQLKKRLEKTSYITVSSICTNEWKELVYETITQGIGRHFDAQDINNARKCGEELTGYYDNLCRIYIKLKKDDESKFLDLPILIRGSTGDENLFFNFIITEVRDFSYIEPEPTGEVEPTDIPDITGEAEPTNEPNPTGEAEPTDEPVPSEEVEPTDNPEPTAEVKPTEEPEVTEEITPTDEPRVTEVPGLTDTYGGNGTDKPGGSDQNNVESSEEKNILPFIIVGAVAALVAIGIVVVVVNKKKKTKIPEGALKLKIEVYNGKCLNRSEILYMTESLSIGTAKNNDIIFDDQSVKPVHAKITFINGVVYVEDINDSGVSLGGMRINSRNVLRSRDLIMIGNVAFSLTFPV